MHLLLKSFSTNSCLKGGRGGGDQLREEVLREEPLKHMKGGTENELEGGQGKKRWMCWWGWEEIITSILWFSVWMTGGRAGGCTLAFCMTWEGGKDHCSSALWILWEYFDRQSSMLKGNLLLAGSEEAVYRRACQIWSPARPLVWKTLVLWCLSPSPYNLLLTSIVSPVSQLPTFSHCCLTHFQSCVT